MRAGIRDPENMSVARQRIGKHVSAGKNNHTTKEELSDAVFSVRSTPMLYKKNHREFEISVSLRGFKLALVRLTAVQVTKLPL
jgi:hypothetical protein